MAAADVDVGYIAGHLALDQTIITTLTTDPTVELVTSLLHAVAAKAQEFDTLFAEKLQTDIELENAVRSSESWAQASRATAEKARKDLEEVRQKLNEEETKRQTVENELQSLKAKSTGHDAEVKTLNDKIETLQSSNRTNLSIIESNNKRDQTLSEELTKQHQKNVELSREISSLQQSEQAIKGQLSSAKYRENSLQQQLDLARQNGEWLESELKNKSDESLKYRKEKGARIAELQRHNEDLIAEIETLKRANSQLRERLTTSQAKLDEALVKQQTQKSAYASMEESYRHELDAQRRLVEMSDQLSKKHQERVRELEAEKERLKDNYESEIHRVRVELEQERQQNTEMEDKIKQLENEVDDLQARHDHAIPPSSAPQTPRANGSSLARPGSPFATPGSVRKSAITATQAIDQLYQVKGQLASERRRNQQLSEELDSMMTALEAKAPEIHDLQSEADTLRTEIARMSELSQQSFEERDNARKAARKAEGALSSAQSEVKILRTQLRDLGTEIQMLVFNIYAMEKGVDQLTDDEKFRLKQLERGEITQEALSDMSDTHQFITEKLVVFKDIQSLQTKNQDLLRITRELADQIESEEALAAKHQAKHDHDMVEKLQQEVNHLTEETNSIKSTMKSYREERDMFRRLLQQRGAVGEDASMMRWSVDGSSRPPLASIETAEHVETLNEALRKLQGEFDNFREAQNSVRADLRDQIDRLSSEKNSLQADKIRAQGEARLEHERNEMLQANYAALQSENKELSKQKATQSEVVAKQDMQIQMLTEDYIQSKSLADSMQNETANLKAEKKLWSDIHERMSKDNESLIEEKNRLNSLLSTQQTVENERILSESEGRRRAQARAETLERELNEAQRKLSNEMEEVKKLQLRKEYELKEAQKRTDELIASLSQLREEHVGVKTTRDHLQARVDELTIELRNAEDRVGRLQPRPTPRPGTSAESSQQQQQLEAEILDLNNEVSDLKRELDLTKAHLENAQAQAEQYKELSQSNEEALEDIRAGQDQWRQEMESLVEQKDLKIKELQQRVEDMSTELSQTNTELSTLRDSQGEVARRYQDEKVILEEEVTRLKEEAAKHIEAARFHQADLRAQAEVAANAQRDYEQELVKHADAAKLLQQLRNEYHETKSEIVTLRAEAESARVVLAQSEDSWEEQRQHLEQEMGELRKRRDDVNAQNKLLHQQLEGLTAQVTALQQSRSVDDNGEDTTVPIVMGDVTDGLRELNSYLRREKEILEVQHDLKSQEARRLQQQLDYTQSQLDETKLKLDQERTQATQSGRTSMAHQELMEKLNELNLYRESSMTLRNENARLKDLVAEKTKAVEEIEAKVQPLEAEIETLNTQKSFMEEEIKQVQEDRDRWQKRTEGILTKYGRVDPAEMEGLQEKIRILEAERNTLKEAEQPLKVKVTELETTLETERNNWSTTRSRMTDQFKERSKRLSGEKNEAIQRAAQLEKELAQATNELESIRPQVEQANTTNSDAENQIRDLQQQATQLQQQLQAAQEAAEAAQATSTVPQTPLPNSAPEEATVSAQIVVDLERQLVDARKELEALNAQKLGAEQQLERLREEMRSAVEERDNTIRRLEEAAASQSAANSAESAPATALIQSGDAATAPEANSSLSDEEKAALQEKIAAAEAKASDAEERANEVEAKITQTIKERSDRMKDALNAKLKESRAKLEEEFQKKEDDIKLRFEQEKQIWMAENSVSTPAAEAPPKTPAKTEAPGTPATTGPPDLSQLDEPAIRQFLSSNNLVKSIMGANIRKKVEAEQTKFNSELEVKVSAAREQAQMLESKKSTLRINMSENKLRTANAKLAVVETAAKETPQKPVVEVWEVAKSATAPAPIPTPATPAAVKTTPAKPPTGPPGMAPGSPAVAQGPVGSNPSGTTPAPTGAVVAGSQTPAGSPAVSNPFVVPPDAANKDAPNPFVPNAAALTASGGNSAGQAQSQLPQPPQQQQPGQGPVRSGLPMPRGGGRGRGGAYVTPGQRGASGNQESSLPQPPASRGGRGGARGGRGGMNPNVQEFQPGNKRPRGDSEVGGGAKRARGAH